MTLGLYKNNDIALTKEKIIELRERTPVGTYIKFKKTKNDTLLSKTKTIEKIEGVVEEVYPNIFKLKGKYYQWVDYAIGYVY